MEDKKLLEETLLRDVRPAYRNSSGTHVNVRCPYCGDSRKSKASAHMYIKTSEAPHFYFCQRCNATGVVTQQTLRDLQIYSTDLSVTVSKANKNARLTSKHNPSESFSLRKEYDIQIYDTDQTKRSRNYLEERFGLEITDDFIKKAKIVLDPFEFLNRRNYKLYKGFNFENSVGFISSDNTHLILRDIDPKAKRRYNNYDLTGGKEMFASKIYNIKGELDLSKEKVTLVLAEGVFDIIGIYKYFYEDKDLDNSYIFAAAAGKGYFSAIMKFIRMGFLDLDIEIYSDADVSVDFLRDITRRDILIGTNIKVYKNRIGKDFGVRRDKIELSSIHL